MGWLLNWPIPVNTCMAVVCNKQCLFKHSSPLINLLNLFLEQKINLLPAPFVPFSLALSFNSWLYYFYIMMIAQGTSCHLVGWKSIRSIFFSSSFLFQFEHNRIKLDLMEVSVIELRAYILPKRRNNRIVP